MHRLRCRGHRRAGPEFNRAVFLNLLAKQWLPAIADMDLRLRSEPPARVADLACGSREAHQRVVGQDSEYTASLFQAACQRSGIIQSMGRPGSRTTR